MKAAPFELAVPASLEEALELLERHGEGAKVIAGGQSLMPLLALRFAQPEVLVDLNRIGGLAGVRRLDDGGVAIGAMTRTRTLEDDPTIAALVPLAAQAAPLIAHRAIRNRGTVGGAIAHADAAAELPAVMLASGATMVAASAAGRREIPAADFFLTHYTTALEPTEILVELRVPPLPAGAKTSFQEISRRHGDFAMAGAAAMVELDGGRVRSARVAVFGVADRALAIDTAPLLDRVPQRDALEEFATAAVAPLDPSSDQHASAEYRRHLAAVLVRRTLEEASAAAAA
ncbi:MAG TPA: FAD binding domain-containing protein [Solirubrobacterales bacterium]